MNLALWIAQGLLAVLFGMAGVMKATQPLSKLQTSLPWTTRIRPATVRLIGVSELLGALGLVLPLGFGFAPFLTPLAALGLAVIMVLAMLHHLRHKEPKAIVFNLVLFLIASFIALGRSGRI